MCVSVLRASSDRLPAVELLRGLGSLPQDESPTVVTVGFFDGVHLGHRAVFERTVEVARERRRSAVAVTFDRHPREIISPGKEPRLLTTVERKAALIEETGIDALVVLEFTEEFSRWSAEEFLQRVLRDGLHAEHVVVGQNFTFGFKAKGTPGMLVEVGPANGFSAEGVPLVELDERRVSSSSVRDALSAGDLTWPRRALGRRFVLEGTVVAGAGRGHGLGFPTANLRTWPRLLLPGNGIYAGRAQVGAERHLAAISCGTNPQFGSEPLHIEAYLLDFDGDLVGEALSVEFWERLRDEKVFGTPEDLVLAIGDDVRHTRELVILDEA